MSDTNTVLKIEEIIGLLDSANKTLETKVELASVPDKIVVSSLNAFHTKAILKSAASGIFSDYQFALVIYNILKEVVKFPLEQLTVLDKALLLLFLRQKNISDDLEVTLSGIKKNENGEDEVVTKKEKVKISKILSKLKFTKSDLQDNVVDTEEYSVTLKWPTIKEEYDLTDHLYKTKLANIDETNKNTIKSLIAPVFVYSIVPYIKSLKIGDREITVCNKKIDERLAIMEKLSAKITSKIIQTIEDDFVKHLNKVTEVKVVEDDVTYVGAIKLNAELFIVA